MRLEEKILAECCRIAPDAHRLGAHFSGPVDWSLLVDLAKWHGLRPVLAQQVEKLPEAVPTAALVHLREQARVVACRNLSLTAELVKVLNAFASWDIQAFPLKGPALAIAAYGSIAAREFEDLDVFIRKESFFKARTVLSELGYQSSICPDASDANYLEYCHQKAFSGIHSGTIIELHWSLQERKFLGVDLKPEAWWARLEVNTICGYAGYGLAPADLILFLCVHGAKHAWERWKWICDVAALMERMSAAAWDSILHQAMQLGALPLLLFGLALASEFTGASLPDAAKATLKNEKKSRRVMAIQRMIESNSEAQILPTALFHLQMHDTLKTRARYIYQQLFAPTVGDWESLRLPASFAFLYPALRPFRLAADRFLVSPRRPR